MADREDPRQQDRTKTPPQGPPQDAASPPQEEEVIVEDGNNDLTGNDPLSGMEEPYGCQVLRMWYEAFILQMQEVDSVLQPLDNPKVIKLAMTIQQNIDKMIQAIQALHAGEYESRGLPPLSEPVQEEEVIMEDSEPEDIDDMRPTPDEAVVGMQSMGLRGKSFSSYSGKGLVDHLIKNMDVGQIGQKAVQKVGMGQLLSILGNLQRELGISEGAAKRQQQEFVQKYRSKYPKISEGQALRDEDITDQHKEAFLKLIGSKDPTGKPQTLQDYRDKARRYATDEARIRTEMNEDVGKNKVAEAEEVSRQIRLPKDQKEVHARRVASGQIPYRMASDKEAAKIDKPRGSTERGGVAISSLPPKMQEDIAQRQASGTMPGGNRYGARIAQRNEQAKADYQDSQMRQANQQHEASHAKSYSMKCMCKEQPCTCDNKNLKESGNKYPQAGDWMKQQAGSILEACDFLDKISTEDEDGGFNNWGEKSRQEAYHLSKVLEGIIPGAEFKEKKVKNMGTGYSPESSADDGMGGINDPNGLDSGNMNPDSAMSEVSKSLFPVRKFLEVLSGEKAFGYQHQEAARACKHLLIGYLQKALDKEGYEIQPGMTPEQAREMSGYAVRSNILHSRPDADFRGVSPRGNLMVSNTDNLKVKAPSESRRYTSSDQEVTEADLENFISTGSELPERIQYANDEARRMQEQPAQYGAMADTLRRMREVESQPKYQNRSGIGNAWDRAYIEASEAANRRAEQTGEQPVVNPGEARQMFELNARTNQWERAIAPEMRRLEREADADEQDYVSNF